MISRYAYVEYPSEAETVEAVAQHKDMELGGQKLYIIKSMTERKETFGKDFKYAL